MNFNCQIWNIRDSIAILIIGLVTWGNHGIAQWPGQSTCVEFLFQKVQNFFNIIKTPHFTSLFHV
jgi:hypothetical protein